MAALTPGLSRFVPDVSCTGKFQVDRASHLACRGQEAQGPPGFAARGPAGGTEGFGVVSGGRGPRRGLEWGADLQPFDIFAAGSTHQHALRRPGDVRSDDLCKGIGDVALKRGAEEGGGRRVEISHLEVIFVAVREQQVGLVHDKCLQSIILSQIGGASMHWMRMDGPPRKGGCHQSPLLISIR